MCGQSSVGVRAKERALEVKRPWCFPRSFPWQWASHGAERFVAVARGGVEHLPVARSRGFYQTAWFRVFHVIRRAKNATT